MSTETMPVFAHPYDEKLPYGAVFSVDEIKRLNREAGHYFFEPDTMRFFGSRVMPGVTAGRLFVTSERSGFDYDSPRQWTLREFMPDGSIEEIGDFGAFDSGRAAKRAASRAADELHSYYFDGRHGKGGREVVYVVTGARDPWHAMARLHSNFRINHVGRARDYMLEGPSADHYVKLEARS